MIKLIVPLFTFILFLSLSQVKGQTADQELNIALILTDSYHELGEATAKDAKAALATYEIEAEVQTYYHADLDLLTYEELKGNQLVFIDMINASKVENVLPLLNRMASQGTRVFAVGSSESSSLEAFKYIQLDAKTLAFYEQSGRENLVNMILDQCQRSFDFDIPQLEG